MKKIFSTLCLAMLFAQSVSAQVFTIGEGGEALADNAEITVTDVEEHPVYGDILNANLFIKNTLASASNVKVEFEIESISSGRIQICYPGSCISKSEVGIYMTGGPDKMEAGISKDLQTEWFPEGEGTCRVRYTIKRFSGNTPLGNTSTVIVNYVYGNSAAVQNVAVDEVVSVKFFDLTGREIAHPRSGACIQRKTLRSGKVLTRKFVY